MPHLGDITSSALFWIAFWPSLSLGLAAVVFLAMLMWLQAAREA